MAEQKGVDGVVKIGAGAGAATAILNVTSYTLEETTETLDVTSMTDTSRQILSTFKGFTGTIDGYWDGSSTHIGHDADDDPDIKAGDTINFELYPAGEAATALYYSGSAIVTSISRSASFDGAVEYSIAFDGTGDLAFEATDDS